MPKIETPRNGGSVRRLALPLKKAADGGEGKGQKEKGKGEMKRTEKGKCRNPSLQFKSEYKLY